MFPFCFVYKSDFVDGSSAGQGVIQVKKTRKKKTFVSFHMSSFIRFTAQTNTQMCTCCTRKYIWTEKAAETASVNETIHCQLNLCQTRMQGTCLTLLFAPGSSWHFIWPTKRLHKQAGHWALNKQNCLCLQVSDKVFQMLNQPYYYKFAS